MSSEPIASAPAPGQSAAPGKPAFGTDAELVLAALGRMEAAIRGERETLDHLRSTIGTMLSAVAGAKQAVGAGRPVDTAMLLDELEHCLDAMLEVAGVTPPEPTPDALARVPTVSDVVSRLGRGDAPEELQRQGPTVSELEAMVQALSAPAPVEAPAEAKTAAIAAPETAALPAEAAMTETAVKPQPPSPPAEPKPESDDLNSFLFGPDLDLPVITDLKQPRPATPVLPAVDLLGPKATLARGAAPPPADKPSFEPHDPLAPLNAMSAAERLALFS